MDKTTLVERDIEEGERLIRTLDSANIPVEAALWFYMAENDRWRLLIATPLVDEKGPREAYATIRRAIEQMLSSLAIRLSQISVVSPDDDLVQLLRAAIQTGPSISGIRFTGNVINGVFIDDAYIYRVQ